MHPVRAEVAGCYAKFCLVFGSARLGGHVCWLSGSTIRDGNSLECGCRCWKWPSCMVPALPAAECELACNPRNVECPASGPPAPHSTAHRVVPLAGVGLGECGTYRNGSRVSNLIGRMCLYINGCSLTRWMYPVRADAAGRWETTSVDVGIGS